MSMQIPIQPVAIGVRTYLPVPQVAGTCRTGDVSRADYILLCSVWLSHTCHLVAGMPKASSMSRKGRGYVQTTLVLQSQQA